MEAISLEQFDSQTAKNISSWLNGLYDEATKREILVLLQSKPQEITDAFYTSLSFGTGGMRGLMGVGSNRMNVYTIRSATQGLANYVNKQPPPPKGHAAFIGYDSRCHSRLFAEEAAKVLAGNNIKVFLCKNIRPTPLVSFGCRFKECTTAIMITASHNPAEYNGYKVYWSDGGQVLPPHDTSIVKEAAKITDPSMVKVAKNMNDPLISFVEEEIDAPYLDKCSHLQHYGDDNKRYGKDLKIVYTSLHGTGITLVPEMLARWGFPTIAYVDQQIIPDGHFPTVKKPNPEEKEALALGIQKLKESDFDLLVATDPDADRVGVAVKHQGDVLLISGNQMAALCLAHVCEALTKQAKMPANAAFIKSIVTTELFQAICDAYHKPCINVLTGFKYIAEKIHAWESHPNGFTYVFGAEESYGYLLGTVARDKDAVIMSALICEMALQAKRQNKTLIDLLHDLYRKYGVFLEGLLSVDFEESKEGKEQMTQGMQALRTNIPLKINDIDVVVVEDLQTLTRKNVKDNTTTKVALPASDGLIFWLANGSKLTVRPSGTEPKIKLYCGVVDKEGDGLDITLKCCQAKISQLLTAMKQILLVNR